MSIHEQRAKSKANRLFSGIEYERAGRGKVGYLQSDGTLHPNASLGLSAGLIWVLQEGERSSVSAVPIGVSARYGLGFEVILKRDRITRTLYAYLDVERAADAVGWETGLTLATPDVVGDLDDSTVNQRRLKIGRLYAPAGDLVFRVAGFWYKDTAGALKWWNDKIQDSDHKADTTANVPGSSNQHKLVIISLNPDATTPALVKTAGSDVSISTTFAEDDIETLVATVNSAYYPLYVVELVNGDTSVPEKQVWAIQELINNPASAGTTIEVEEDGSAAVTGVEKIIFDGATVTDNMDGTVTVSDFVPSSLSVTVLQDQKAQNTAGGTATSGSWETRVLNTEVIDTGGNCTLASNQFALLAGTYTITVACPANQCGEHQARLQNITDTATTLLGTSAYTQAGTANTSYSHILGAFTIAATKTFEIQHRVATTRSTDGYGVQANFGTEVYTSVTLTKIA